MKEDDVIERRANCPMCATTASRLAIGTTLADATALAAMPKK